MDTGRVVMGLLTGIAVGAIAGVLFAPAKGTVTRKKLSKKGENYLEDLEDKYNELINRMVGKLENTKGGVHKNIKHATSAVNHIKKVVKHSAR